MKHWPECWRYASHHACAVAEVERLRAELERRESLISRLAGLVLEYVAMREALLGLCVEATDESAALDVAETAARGASGEEE